MSAEGVFLGMRAELLVMVRQGAGSIVNVTSVAGLLGCTGIAPYVASKHAVIGLTTAASLEVATKGMRVNAIGPRRHTDTDD